MNDLKTEKEVIKSIELFINGLNLGVINLGIKKGDLAN